jgi:NAD(P)-dependent dehydrogenase (short-subunit alcohol dehydrogenase family)
MTAAAASGDAFPFESPWGQGRPLAGRTALVTGAGRGIGRGVAAELAAAGAYVVAADLDIVTAQETIDGLAGPGEAARVDVADPASAATAASSTATPSSPAAELARPATRWPRATGSLEARPECAVRAQNRGSVAARVPGATATTC